MCNYDTRNDTRLYINTCGRWSNRTNDICYNFARDEKITKTGDALIVGVDETGSTISFSLTQEETLGLAVGSASVQVRFIDIDGVAQATEIATLNVDKVLLNGVITYADDTD